MKTPASDPRAKQHRFPAELISHGGWLYGRVCLSDREVEALRFARGMIGTYDAIRQWCRPCGHASAPALRQRRPRPGDTWHLDEVCLTMNGERQDLGRAIRMATSGIFSSNAVATSRPRRSFSARS